MALNGRDAGSFGLDAIARMIAAGQIDASSLVWAPGMAQWQPAGTVVALAALFQGGQTAPTQAPPPVRPDPKTFLVGTWIDDPSQVAIPGLGMGMATSTGTNFTAEGGFTAGGRIEVPVLSMGTIVMLSEAQGTYTAQWLGDSKLQISIKGIVQTKTPGASVPGGSTGTGMPQAQVPPTTTPIDSSETYDVIDDRTMRSSKGIISRKQ